MVIGPSGYWPDFLAKIAFFDDLKNFESKAAGLCEKLCSHCTRAKAWPAIEAKDRRSACQIMSPRDKMLKTFGAMESGLSWKEHKVDDDGTRTPLFPIIKQIYVKYDVKHFGVFMSELQNNLCEKHFVHLLSFFEEKMLQVCNSFTLKAMEECNEN